MLAGLGPHKSSLSLALRKFSLPLAVQQTELLLLARRCRMVVRGGPCSKLITIWLRVLLNVAPEIGEPSRTLTAGRRDRSIRETQQVKRLGLDALLKMCSQKKNPQKG